MVAVIHKEEHLNSNKLADNFELDTTTEEEEQAFTEERNRTEYKPVVIIGNGPSGIILSYFLAGNWPYYNGLGESVNDMLHYRLLAGGTGENQEPLSLVEQDLDFLSQVKFPLYSDNRKTFCFTLVHLRMASSVILLH